MSGPITRPIRIWAAALLAITAAATMQAGADTFYVNGSCGNDAWTGTSSVCSAPNGPKLTIQAGIDASVNGDTVSVADGTYTGAGNKNLDFVGRLITLRSQNGPAACIIDCENDGRGISFHNNETADAMLVGFTIRNGHLTGTDFGGAIRCESSDPTILNCVFVNNHSREGGALYCLNANPTISECEFRGNTGEHGGGMFNIGANPTVTNCTFTNNAVEFFGGGMDNNLANPTVTNCAFSGNSARFGAGMYNRSRSPTLTNCTFSENSAESGGGMYTRFSNPEMNNCILWNDRPDESVDVDGALTTVRFSDVQGGWPGQGNIDADPLFVDPANGDYRLSAGSPCIDAADNRAFPPGILTDLAGKWRFVDDPATPDTGVPGGAGGPDIVDMGAYEFQACDPCDMNCDGDVNALDIEFFIDILFNGATPCAVCTGDTNGDGNIDAADIEGFINCLFP